MDFYSGLTVFIAANAIAGAGAIAGARRMAGGSRADFALAAGTLYFFQVTAATALAGLTGNINTALFWLICAGVAVAAVLLSGAISGAPADRIRMPRTPSAPAITGFFLLSRRQPPPE